MTDVVYLDKTISWSGKYAIFYGLHYEKGHACYVVGCHNLHDHYTQMRHYNSTIPGCLAPRAQARTFWEEFRNKMTTIPEGREYEPTYLEGIKQYLN